MQLNRLVRRAHFALNKRKHIRYYPYISMVVLHHFFQVFGIDIARLNEEKVHSPVDASIAESLPVIIYNAIYTKTTYLKYIDILELNIKQLYEEGNEWSLWMIELYDNKMALNKEKLQEVALLSHDSMARDYIQWELKVNVPIAELIEHVEDSMNTNTARNRRKRKRNK